MSQSTVDTQEALPTASAAFDSKRAVHFVTGRDEVLRLSGRLAEFSAYCGQPGTMSDIDYFLSKPGLLPRTPHLLLVGRPGMDVKRPKIADLLGLLLIFEQRVSGFGPSSFATNDRSGRNTVIALPADRARVAELTTRALLNRGAHLVLMSFRGEENLAWPPSPTETPLLSVEEHGRSVARWARRERTIPGYLPLAGTLDATLAKVGQKTRRNLRYYRRRAESGLGCMFLPKIEIPLEEMQEFNRECMYAAPETMTEWRYHLLKKVAEPVFMGIKDRDGRWLSMLGGRRYMGRMEILWQLNRDGLAEYSLGTVMRCYVIEHEIGHGSVRLYTEGGTPHSMQFSFVTEELIDLAVVRRSLVAKAMHMVARRYIKKSEELSGMLSAPDIEWLPC